MLSLCMLPWAAYNAGHVAYMPPYMSACRHITCCTQRNAKFHPISVSGKFACERSSPASDLGSRASLVRGWPPPPAGQTPVLQPHLQQGSHNAIFDIRFLVHSHRMLQPSLQHLSRRPHRCARLKSHTARPPQPAYAASISDLNLSTTALRLSFCAFVTSPLCGVHSSGLRMTS
jgi:hypothetical protein